MSLWQESVGFTTSKQAVSPFLALPSTTLSPFAPSQNPRKVIVLEVDLALEVPLDQLQGERALLSVFQQPAGLQKPEQLLPAVAENKSYLMEKRSW